MCKRANGAQSFVHTPVMVPISIFIIPNPKIFSFIIRYDEVKQQIFKELETANI